MGPPDGDHGPACTLPIVNLPSTFQPSPHCCVCSPSPLFLFSLPQAARLPHEQEAVHRVAWWPGGSQAAWLASGGAAGVLRLQWITML